MSGHTPPRVQRLKDAIEGECDGLGITDAHAAAILQYVDGAEMQVEAGRLREAAERVLHELSIYEGDDANPSFAKDIELLANAALATTEAGTERGPKQ